MDRKAEWSFQALCHARSMALADCPTYRELIRRIAEQVDPEKIKFKIDEGWLEPVGGALRPLFYLKVGEDLGDLFFNGVRGYRGQYYLSVANGIAANRYAFQQLETKLLEAARTAGWRMPDPNNAGAELVMGKAHILESLRAPSAKIWPDETEGELSLVTTSRSDETAQIVAPRWIAAAKEGKQKARKGIKAPAVETLKFHGGFIKNGKERIAGDKRQRSEDIYRYGWS
jgi:hypothetical protein